MCCLNHGSFSLKHSDLELFPSSYRFKDLKNAILCKDLRQNPYRSGSFQLGTEKGFKIEDFSENTVFYVSKLKRLIWYTFRGALSLKQIFSLKTHVKWTVAQKKLWSFELGIQTWKKSWSSWSNLRSCQGMQWETLGALALNHDNGLIFDRFHGALTLNWRLSHSTWSVLKKNLGALALNHDSGLIFDRFHGAPTLN